MEDSAPRVLIITYYWPPSGGSGVQRWLKFVKYLPLQGWQPVVVVPDNADYAVFDESLLRDIPAEAEVLRLPIWEPYQLFRKLTGASPKEHFGRTAEKKAGLVKRLSYWIRANLFIPDPKIAWIKPSVRSLNSYLDTHPVDAIISTGPPHSAHLIVLGLKQSHPDIPWIMDVRDPWSQFDIHLSFSPSGYALRKNKALERKCLEAADRVLATSPSMLHHLEPFDADKFVAITNGFDAEDFAALHKARASTSGPETITQAPPFRIFHTGLLNASRNPIAVWEALDQLCRRSAGFAGRLQIVLIGQVEQVVIDSLARFPALQGRYEIQGWMDHEALLKRYAEADAFLLCPNQSDNAKGQINGKLFEYLAVGRPILHVGPYDSDNTRIIDEAHAGFTVSPGDVDAARMWLQKLIDGHLERSAHALNQEIIGGYERRALTARLADLLQSLRRKKALTFS